MSNKVTCFDVAKYILKSYESHRRMFKMVKHDMVSLRLNILVCYCQAWSLVWDEKPLFNEDIKACNIGPIIEVLDRACKFEQVNSKEIKGETKKLSRRQKFIIDKVLFAYALYDSNELARAQHPWIKSYKRCDECTCINVIPHSDIIEYYFNG